MDLRAAAIALFLFLIPSKGSGADRFVASAAGDTIALMGDSLRTHSIQILDLSGRNRRVTDLPDRTLDFSILSNSRVGVLVTPSESAPASWPDVAARYASALAAREPRYGVKAGDVAFEYPASWNMHAHVRFVPAAGGQVIVHWLAFDGPKDRRDGTIAIRTKWPLRLSAESLAERGRLVARAQVDLDTGRIGWLPVMP